MIHYLAVLAPSRIPQSRSAPSRMRGVWRSISAAGIRWRCVVTGYAFQSSKEMASLPTMTLAKPVVGWILAITVLSETLRVDDEKLLVLVAAVVVMIVSTVALARGEAAGMEALGRRWSKATGQRLATSEG